jgi:hypothetical protein
MTMKLDIEKLNKDINEVNSLIQSIDANDGGTCNLDTVIIKLPKGTRQAGLPSMISDNLSGWHKGWRWIRFNTKGQGNLRNKMVEEAKKLMADRGWDVSIYYQMD